MTYRPATVLIAAALSLPLSAPLSAQTWTEVGAGDLPTTAEATLGSGPLTQISGTIDATEIADLFVIYVDDPATFSCSTVGGAATWDTQLWMFDLQGNGISFRDDDPGTARSTLTGQFLSGPGHVVIGISQHDRDALDAGGLELWLDTPLAVERQPDGPGASNAFTQWNIALALPAAAYTMRLSGASFAGDIRPDEAAVAWAYVNVTGSAPSFTPSLSYQHTPTGELVTVERTALGRFVVDLGTLPSGGVPHVTAYGGNHTAVIESWTTLGGPLRVRVNVFDPTGSSVDEPFCLHFRIGGRDDERAAYLWANNATSPSYTPNATFRFNGSRPAPTIVRTGTGAYQITLPGLGALGAAERGNVQVTAYSGSGNATLLRARVSSWSISGTDIQVNVRTSDATGTAVDARFSMSYHEIAAPIPNHQGSGAHVWANNPTAASYTPSALYTDSNGTVGPANSETIDRVGVGDYWVNLPNVIPISSSIAIATPYGSTAAYASIDGWTFGLATGARVRVHTYDPSGSPVNSRFTLLYLTDEPAGAAASNTVIGTGCSGLVLHADSRPVLDDDWSLTLVDLPPSSLVGFVALGFANPNLPLGALGAPGCWLHNDLVAIETIVLPSLSPTYNLPIPNSAGLIGLTIYAQGAALATGINALDIVTSNGMRGVLGDV